MVIQIKKITIYIKNKLLISYKYNQNILRFKNNTNMYIIRLSVYKQYIKSKYNTYIKITIPDPLI